MLKMLIVATLAAILCIAVTVPIIVWETERLRRERRRYLAILRAQREPEPIITRTEERQFWEWWWEIGRAHV